MAVQEGSREEGGRAGAEQQPRAAAVDTFPGRCSWWWRNVPGFTDTFKHSISTHSDFQGLFLVEKKITTDVAPPPPTRRRFLPVKLVFRAAPVEV